jgi:adenylate cyclase class IV
VASNIEIKARVPGDVEELHARAAAVSDSGPTLIVQEDTFFVVPRGRLKLRVFGDATSGGRAPVVRDDAPAYRERGASAHRMRSPAELIFYERVDTGGPTMSDYSLVPVMDPEALKSALAAALGVRGVVRKRRILYLAKETRIHIDEVDGLGTFLELEVVLPTAAGASPVDGDARCRELMDALGVGAADLVDVAYIDLLEEVAR